MKQKLHLLTGEMSVSQALDTLGLSKYRLSEAGASSGQTANHVYFLRKDHLLRLYAGYIAQSGSANKPSSRIFEAQLDDKTWSAGDKQPVH